MSNFVKFGLLNESAEVDFSFVRRLYALFSSSPELTTALLFNDAKLDPLNYKYPDFGLITQPGALFWSTEYDE